MKRALLRSALALAAVAAMWAGGLAWFTTTIPSKVEDPDTVTDAIVVLTGGSERLDAGLTLLSLGKARKLFVSGVYRGVDVEELLRTAHTAPANLECCIVLGYAADSTMGNAIETAKWMDAEHYRSLRIVTAAYHMPRSMLEFRRAMPQIRLIPNPVFPERVKSDWWLWPGSAYLVLGEYHKYLAALARESVPEIALPGSQQTDS
ncbi:MAG TPA: YdcF family protein [Alphaproteobacteria bacterium]|nr:YdcF family protein [Alphaproteobacteria bacterium]